MAIRSILLVMIMLLTACTTSPTGRQQLLLVTDRQMQQMGITAFQQMKQELPATRDNQTRDYVNCVANAIIRQLPDGERQQWEVVVFEDENANAFALPGGKIGVHTGLLKVAENQDQLATVIAHEVAHVLAQHGGERVSQQLATQIGMDLAGAMAGGDPATRRQLLGVLGLGAQYGILLPYSRAHESEADRFGLELMARAGFDPRASVELWQNMKAAGGAAPPELLSTHPAPDTRIRDLDNQIPRIMPLYNDAVKKRGAPACSR
ncbi:MAG: M48 family metallopeptidase [Gammaproteobacteria bacterium]|nr:M48 family metallopeptidase [Gammaproteobacteria bacterium]